jgi:hypothetical protein
MMTTHIITIAKRAVRPNRWPSTHCWRCSCDRTGRWTRYPLSAQRRGAQHVERERWRELVAEVAAVLRRIERRRRAA